MWTTCLVVAAMLLITSWYTFGLYMVFPAEGRYSNVIKQSTIHTYNKADKANPETRRVVD